MSRVGSAILFTAKHTAKITVGVVCIVTVVALVAIGAFAYCHVADQAAKRRLDK